MLAIPYRVFDRSIQEMEKMLVFISSLPVDSCMFSEILEELDIQKNPESTDKPAERRTVTFDPIVQEYSANNNIIDIEELKGL